MNVKADNETEAEDKVLEALSAIMDVADGYAATGIDGVTLEHQE